MNELCGSSEGIVVREYRSGDCDEIARLFYDTVHAVCVKDYRPEQLQAWAPSLPDTTVWDRSFRSHDTLVAVVGERIVGFADMDGAGYLDRLYVHKDCQARGVATTLCDALESRSSAACFTIHASVTARPFFERSGYVVVCEQEVERHGVLLRNYVMEKMRGDRPQAKNENTRCDEKSKDYGVENDAR